MRLHLSQNELASLGRHRSFWTRTASPWNRTKAATTWESTEKAFSLQRLTPRGSGEEGEEMHRLPQGGQAPTF